MVKRTSVEKYSKKFFSLEQRFWTTSLEQHMFIFDYEQVFGYWVSWKSSKIMKILHVVSQFFLSTICTMSA